MASQMSSSGSSSSGGGNPIKLIVTDSGPGAVPLNGVVNILGGSNINTQEVANNAIINLDDNIVIDSAVISGANGLLLVTNQVAGIENLTPNGSGKVKFSYLNGNSIVITQGDFTVTDVGSMTDGQLAIGSTGLPVANTLTAGPGISITNGPGSITINSTGSGGGGFINWEKIVYRGSGQQTFTMTKNTGYITDSNQTYILTDTPNPSYPIFLTLPDAADVEVGDVVCVANVGDANVIVQPPEDDNTVIRGFSQLIPGVTYAEVKYPGGLISVNRSTIWLQYIGVQYSSGYQANYPTWQPLRIQGAYTNNSPLPSSSYRIK